MCEMALQLADGCCSPLDYSLLCLFLQTLFLALSYTLLSLIYSLSDQSTTFLSNSIQTLLSAEDQLNLLVLNRL